MRLIALILAVALTGCADLSDSYTRMIPGSNLLDTAPKSGYEVMYPEWGDAPVVATNDYQPVRQVASRNVQGSRSQMRMSSYDSLESFLVERGIDYEVLPGSHRMVKLKNSVQFETGSTQVMSSSNQWLRQLGHFLASQHNIDIVIDGHTDDTGTTTVNDGLSEQRARKVKNELVRQNVSADSIFTRGYGEYSPSCSNASIQGKACNRRVELMFIVAN